MKFPIRRPPAPEQAPMSRVVVKHPRVRIVPIVLKKAIPIVKRWHRHLSPPQGALFAIAAEVEGKLVGVAVVGRPVARLHDTGWRAEVLRVATNGAPNACSALLGAAARASAGMGYCEITTKTLLREPGTSLRGAGWEELGTGGNGQWARPSRARKPAEEPGPKRRWRRRLCKGCDRCS